MKEYKKKLTITVAKPLSKERKEKLIEEIAELIQIKYYS